MGDRKLTVEVVAADKVLYAEEADMVVVPGYEGELGILPLHIPMVSILTRGEIRIKHKDHIDYFYIEDGFLEVKEDRAVILASEAIPAQEIEPEVELKAQEEIKRMIEQAKEKGEDFSSLLEELNRSLTRLRVARKAKK
ncbi:MAG: ATP synthase F1 subunit epsilon [Actinobacteria bacterium]|nr:ATP synthase F1 subunit epsilon [Actinomycetota bacterium]